MRIFTRPLLFALGILFVAVGAIGVFLPLLPTTPFLILALWCFSRSSQRFHDWLYHHRLFGPTLQRWEQYRVIPRGAKIVAVCSMVASAAYVILATQTPWPLIALMLAVMGYGAWFVLSKPSKI